MKKEKKIAAIPETMFIGQEFIYLSETTSTNSHLKDLYLKSELFEGTVVSTGFQTQGRGQAGTVWEALPDQNMMISVLLYPNFIPTQSLFLLSKAIALAVYDFICIWLPDEEISIKWPNDIMVGGRKICGILIENGLNAEGIEYCIIGIGININEIPQDKYRTSLKLINGIDYDIRYLEKRLFISLEARYLQLRNNQNKISEDYLTVLHGYKQPLKFLDSLTKEAFTGKIIDIHPDGRLVIEIDKKVRLFSLKEIVFVKNDVV